MPKRTDEPEEKSKNTKVKIQQNSENTHLGSSNAFEETENTISRDADNISDEKLDEMLGDS
jgi:small nuclear ribonucleoprotein (snRNP)-like protein